MKATMKPAMVALTLTLAVCLLFPIVARAQEGQQCGPDPVNMFIVYGADVLCQIDQPGNSDFFRFDGTAGERIKIETLGTSNPCIELVGVVTGCGYGLQNWIDTVLPNTQEYTIRVWDNNDSTDTFSLFLEREVPHNPDARQEAYGQNLPGQFDLAGDLDEFFFTASAGDVVDIKTLGPSNPCFTLYAPDARTTWNACGYGGENELRTGALAAGGTYTIFMWDNNNNPASYRVILECITGPCVVTQIPDVSGYVSLRGAPLPHAGVSLTQPGSPSPQLAITDSNGYYQFLHIISGQTFNVLIHGPASLDFGTPLPAEPASAGTVGEDPLK
jgi:hypothetical protein